MIINIPCIKSVSTFIELPYIKWLSLLPPLMNWFDFFKDDLSYKKNASQSHTFSGTGYGAENAVDGKPATCMRTHVIGQNSLDKTVWWKVDLGGVYNIYSVNILFKNYDGLGISLSNFPMKIIYFYKIIV